MRDCDLIEVTQSSAGTINGTYVRTGYMASTWKHPKEERAIFFAGSATEWRLGYIGHQNTTDYFLKGTNCISKYFIVK